MAEQNDNNSNWFGSWLNAAKNKSTEVLEFVKKDLEEFGSVVKNEATNVVSSAGTMVGRTLSLDSPDSTANNMKKSFSTFLGQMNNVLNPSPDDSDTEAILIGENSETVKLNKLQKAIYELQKSPETYLCDPDPSLGKQYECWLEICEDQLSDDRIAKQVNSSELLKQHYAKLVPDILEHHLFWKRYLFKKALLEDELARQEMVEKKELKEKLRVNENLDDGPKNLDGFNWELEMSNDLDDLSVEEQIKLLDQYEAETKQKKVNNNSSRKKPKETGNRKRTKEEDSSKAKLDSPPTSSSTSNSSIDDEWVKV